MAKYGYAENVRFTIHNSYEEMITGCDVIVSAITYAEMDFVMKVCIKMGV